MSGTGETPASTATETPAPVSTTPPAGGEAGADGAAVDGAGTGGAGTGGAGTSIDQMIPGLGWVETLLSGFAYGHFEGDKVLGEALNADKEKFNKILKDYQVITTTIETAEDLGKLSIINKIIALLVVKFYELTGDGFGTESTETAGELTLPEELKAKMKEFTFADFKTYHEGKETKDLLFKENSLGSPHAIWTEKVLFGFEALEAETLDEPGEVEKWPDIFPYMPGTRVVLGGKSKDEVTKLNNWAKPFFEKGGVNLTVVTDGNPAAAPADNEIQVMATTESEPLDWDQVKLCQELWNGETPVQFSQCLKTLAAVQVLEGKTPEDACEFVGLKEPTEAFLKELEEGEKEPVLDAKVLAAKEYLGVELEPDLDFSKAKVVTKAEDSANFVESFTFMTGDQEKKQHPENAQLTEEQVAYFVSVPGRDGHNGETLAYNVENEVIGRSQ